MVVGAFPEPFLHGYDGQRRPAVVVVHRSDARRPPRPSRARPPVSRRPAGANVLEVVPGTRPRFSARARLEPGAPVRFEVDRAFARSSSRIRAWPATGTRCREAGRRSHAPRRARRRRAARDPHGLGGALIARVLLARLPARAARRAGGSTSSARSSPALGGLRAHAVRRDHRLAPVLDGADGARARRSSTSRARSSHSGALPGAAARRRSRSRSPRMRCCSTTTGCVQAAAFAPPLGAHGRARDAARAHARARRVGARRGAARARAWRCAACAGMRGCSRRCSPGRSSAALNLAEAMEARGFGRPGRNAGAAAAVDARSTGSHWPRPSSLVAMGALWL